MSKNKIVSDSKAWPNLSLAVKILGLKTIRLEELGVIPKKSPGRLETRVSPAKVMELNRKYRQRVQEEVIYDLVENARLFGEDRAKVVEGEIEAYLIKHPTRAPEIDKLLNDVQGSLSPELYEQVKHAALG